MVLVMTNSPTPPAVASVPHIAPPWQCVTDLEFLAIVAPDLALAEFARFAGWMRHAQAPATESSARAVRRDAHALGLTRRRESADDRRKRKHAREMKALWGPGGGGR